MRFAELHFAVLGTELFGEAARVVRFVERGAGATESERIDLAGKMATHERDDRARIHSARKKRSGGRPTESACHGGFEKIPIAPGYCRLIAQERLRIRQAIPGFDARFARDRVELNVAAGGNAPHIAIQRGVAGNEAVREKLDQPLRRELEWAPVERAEIAHAAAEHEVRIARGVIEGLGTEAISQQHEAPARRIPPYESEGAFDSSELREAALAQSAKQPLRAMRHPFDERIAADLDPRARRRIGSGEIAGIECCDIPRSTRDRGADEVGGRSTGSRRRGPSGKAACSTDQHRACLISFSSQFDSLRTFASHE